MILPGKRGGNAETLYADKAQSKEHDMNQRLSQEQIAKNSENYLETQQVWKVMIGRLTKQKPSTWENNLGQSMASEIQMNGEGGEKFIRLMGEKNQIVRAQQGKRNKSWWRARKNTMKAKFIQGAVWLL